MQNTLPNKIKTISEFHQLRGLPQPKHPLISVVRFEEFQALREKGTEILLFDFYAISLKRGMNHHYKYGQRNYEYDFNNGIMFYMAPNQLLSVEVDDPASRPNGWMLMIHPDFIWNTSLATNIKKYDFSDYSANEALFLSEDEEATLNQLIVNIQKEYNNPIDTFSQAIIISQLETLFNYSERFYQRQFITRQKVNHEILVRLEDILNEQIKDEYLFSQGIPSVQDISEKLNVSTGYLRNLLKQLTGLSTQQHIHEKLISKAKEKLSTTNLTVSEIAYHLGFEQPQSFSRLFKNKTNQSPLEFREKFN